MQTETETRADQNALRIAVLNCGLSPQGRCSWLAMQVRSSVVDAGCEALSLELGYSGQQRQSDSNRDLIVELDRCDGAAIIAPILFAGPSARLKDFYDSMQLLWIRRYGQKAAQGDYCSLAMDERRPLYLLAVGEGGDPFGYEPLSVITHSAMRMMDYELVSTYGCIGHDDDKIGDLAYKAGGDLARAVQERGFFSREGIRAAQIVMGSQ